MFRQKTKQAFVLSRTILGMAKNDFRSRYASSYLGIFWAFAQPLATILVFWFVFQVGLRAQSVREAPYIAWLTTGLIPWFYFSDGLLGGASSVVEYSFLVKKVVFPIWILPIVKAISALFIHTVFFSLAFIICLLTGIKPNFTLLFLPFYTLSLTVFMLSLSRFAAAIFPFFRDLGPIISIGLQFGMWLTPIMWEDTMIPESVRWILKLNPVYFCVDGYRRIILWHDMSIHWRWAGWFWSVTLIASLISWYVFKRLRPHYADVL